jgi:hypothetical protein
MAQRSLCFVVLGIGLLMHLRALAVDDDAIAKARHELLPRPVNLNDGAIPLSDALAQLSRQTGNQVVDRRHAKADPKLALKLINSSFWPALDVIARTVGCGVSTYQADGRIALVDAPQRQESTAYQGIFRIVAKRVSVTLDHEAGKHTCLVGLDVAWEPRFEPLYLEPGPIQAIFAAASHGTESHAAAAGQPKINVAGRNAQEVPILLQAPMRSSAKIKSFEGHLQVTGPAKMLTFTFPHLKAIKKGDPALQHRQEGVQVSLVEIKTESRRWSIMVHIDNPPGNSKFESFQSWLGNNRIALERGDGLDRKTWTPQPYDERVDTETATHAEIHYSFPIAPKEKKGTLADWTLVYRTPGRIVDVQVPFVFKDVSLP